MPITAICPACQMSYQVQPSLRGQSLRCPNVTCRKVFTVPTDEQSAEELPWWVQAAQTDAKAKGASVARATQPAAIGNSRLILMGGIAALGVVLVLLLVVSAAYLLSSPTPAASLAANAGEPVPEQPAAPAPHSREAAPDRQPVPEPAAAGKQPEEKPRETVREKPAVIQPRPEKSPSPPARVEKPLVPKAEPEKPPVALPPPPKKDRPAAPATQPPGPELFTEPPPDKNVYLAIKFSADHRFGITLSDAAGPLAHKRLTFAEDGATNNTCVFVAGQSFLFRGQGPIVPARDGLGWTSTASYLGGRVLVTQDVRIRRGEDSRKLDTCRVRYSIENRDSRPQSVGLRFMLDTLIGENDGVPFTIPGQPGLCTHSFRSRSSVPDYVQALERPRLQSPGTVAQLTVKVPDPEGKLEPPARLLLTHWPGPDAGWTVPLLPIFQDSSAVLYWPAKLLEPGQKRQMAFDYGLGSLSSNEGGSLALTLGGSLQVGGELTVVAYVNKPTPGLTVTIEVPAGLTVLDDTPLTQRVPKSESQTYTQVSWRLRSEKAGKYRLRATLSNGASQSKDVLIRPILQDNGPVASPPTGTGSKLKAQGSR